MNRLASWALACGMFLAPGLALAFGLSQCAGDRFGANLGCNANDVSISAISVASGPASCTGGSSITLDLDITVNFSQPDRWDIGIFISNDGKNPELTSASGGAASCSVAVLPLTAPFLDLDGGGASPRDTCGDGNKGINGGTGSGVIRMNNVTVPCQAFGSSGQLYIPFVVSWDNQESPNGDACRSAADPVPNTKSKCNAPVLGQGNVSVTVLPAITKSDGIDVVTPGVPTTYAIVVTNNTGIVLNAAVFRDAAVAGLSVSGVVCSASGGAVCPASTTVAGMQGAGLTIPSLPNGGSVTFAVTATVDGGTPAGVVITNVADVTANGSTNSASDTNTVVYPSIVHLKTVAVVSDPVNGSGNPKNIPGAVVDYALNISNTGQGSATSNSVTIVDPIPANTELFTGDLGGGAPFLFTDGVPASGLTCAFNALGNFTDCVDFSTDGGGTWTYVPTGGFDPAVTHLRFRPAGTFAGDAVSGAPSPGFDLRFRVRVK